jgi:hypothetical protein
MTEDIIEFVRGESRINRNRQIMKPEFGFLVAHANVNMGGLLYWNRRKPDKDPNAEPSALIRPRFASRLSPQAEAGIRPAVSASISRPL